MEKIAVNKYRTVDNGSLRIEDAGKTVKLAGWVDTIRNFGELTFVVLRDTYGKTQVVLNKEFIALSKEDVISVEGKVVERESKNKNMPTGDIEVVAESIVMLGKCSKELPFEIKNSEKVAEDIRLKYRYLDLRADYNQKMLKLRSDLLLFVRNYMNEQNFVEVQTPILTASSPEGARDFLVPSRLNPGKFYALPQAPQQFKQLLMVSGIDRYFQIAPCFRDEDARADRSPTEFYQIDMEMAFATQEDVFEVIEGLYSAIFKKFANFEISEFKRIKYADAIRDYCTDKPDLRNPLKVVDVSNVFRNTEFSVFKNTTIKAIKAATGGAKPRKWYDKLTDFLKSREAKGLAYFVVGENDELSAGVSKFVTEEEKAELKKLVGFETGDTVFFIADEEERAIKFTNVLRNELGKELELIDENDYKFCWIVDFPFFEKDDEGNIAFSHNPFSLPQSPLEEIKKDPFGTLAYQYDLVINGYESLSGAVRNHNQDMMVELFKLAGYGKEVVENKFPALYNAFSYGAPPHAGSAPGFDRLMMLLTHNEFIRDVYAFPMNKNAQDPLCNAPNTVDEKLLRDVHIKLIEE
ncbi:MAG: aspartate--tRNA ligase [Clostridia bacterium]|nr:aspartate--tRNA ligase [Clostridia bacterium]